MSMLSAYQHYLKSKGTNKMKCPKCGGFLQGFMYYIKSRCMACGHWKQNTDYPLYDTQTKQEPVKGDPWFGGE